MVELNEIQAALPLLVQLLTITVIGALLVGLLLAIIKFVIQNAIIIILVLVAYIAWQNGVFI